jgi:2',3'-cyclic-nucleotide 2'-phosphodiesterase (5'-nucleotidase family)
LVFPGRLGGIRIEDPAAAARRLVRQLDPVTDLIVLLTHQGFREDSLLASAVPQADVIIGGHSHSVLKRPVRVNGVLVCQAGSNSEWLGRLDLDVRDDRIASYSARLVPVQCRAGEADPEVARLVDDYRLRIEAQYGRVIGKIKTAWTPARDRESNIGDFFADVIRERAGTDFAVINSGGIRKGLGRGPVREMDILEIFPFENRLVRFSCTGREVLKLVGTNARSAYERSRGILQVSGLRYTAHRDRMGNVAVREAWINREPVRTDRVYTAAAVDYLVHYNAREFFGFEPGSEEDLGVFLADAAIEYIRSHPVIQSRVEGRMRHER